MREVSRQPDSAGIVFGCATALAFAGLMFLVVFFGALVQISVGEVGILREWGAVDITNPKTLGPGIHWKMPFKDDVVEFPTQVQRADIEKIAAASRDGISVETHLVVNYRIDGAAAPLILQEIGTDYVNRVLSPAVQQAYKDVSGNYAALEMIQNRQQFADEAQKVLAEKVRGYHLIVDSLSILNLEFPQSFDEALQATQVANQNRIKAQQDNERAKIEADTARIQAEGLAAAQKAQAVSITEAYLQLQAIQKWDGRLPQYLSPGAALPFLGTAPITGAP